MIELGVSGTVEPASGPSVMTSRVAPRWRPSTMPSVWRLRAMRRRRSVVDDDAAVTKTSRRKMRSEAQIKTHSKTR